MKELRIRLNIVDTGGERNRQRLRIAAVRALTRRIALYKGASSRTAPLIKESKVGKGA